MADETTPAPLSDAELAEIQQRLVALANGLTTDETDFFKYLRATDDARRLLATLAAYREIVAAVATTEREDDIPGDPGATRIAVALVDRARALLGAPAPGTTAGEDGEA